MNKNDLKAALKWQVEMGVEDIFANSPAAIKKTAPAKEAENVIPINIAPPARSDNFEIPEQRPIMPRAMREPAAKPIATESMHSNNEWVKKAKEQADSAKTLAELKEFVTNFDGLAIKKAATNTVFGEGNPESDIMFIGEAPGENEDLEARPFCGVSGQLLDKMLKFIGLERKKNFYITNTLFWRPPGNRKPLPEEIAICKPFVEKHIALINPKVIVLIGATATYGILNSKDSVSLMRRSIHEYKNEYLSKPIPCFAIYHPSYLLRSPSQKKVAWGDMIKIKKYLETL